MAKVTHFRVAGQVGCVLAGLLVPALYSVEVHAAEQFQADRPSLISVSADRLIELAAEMKPITPSGPNQSGKDSASTPIDDKRADARLEQCKLQWTAADTDGEGVLTGSKITRYNQTIRAPSQPLLSEDARLSQADFMKACMAVTAHE